MGLAEFSCAAGSLWVQLVPSPHQFQASPCNCHHAGPETCSTACRHVLWSVSYHIHPGNSSNCCCLLLVLVAVVVVHVLVIVVLVFVVVTLWPLSVSGPCLYTNVTLIIFRCWTLCTLTLLFWNSCMMNRQMCWIRKHHIRIHANEPFTLQLRNSLHLRNVNCPRHVYSSLRLDPILCHGSFLHPVCSKVHVDIILQLIPTSAVGIVFTIHWYRYFICN